MKQSINQKRKSRCIHKFSVVEININFYNAWREILFGDVYNRLSNPNEKVGDKGQEKGRKKDGFEMRGLKNNHSHCTASREEEKKNKKRIKRHSCITKYKFEIDDEVPRTTSHFLIFLFLLFFPYSGIYLFQNAFPFCIRKRRRKKNSICFSKPPKNG